MRVVSSLPALLALAAASLPLLSAATKPGPVPDPREIPLPVIKTPFPDRPGPSQLPVRKELPDALTMNDGTKVTTAAQWPARRQEIAAILEYYAVGHAPPPPGNVRGTEVVSELVESGKYRYRLVHLTFGPHDGLALDIGIYTPNSGGPFPAVISPSGPPPGSKPLTRLDDGPNQGKGEDVLLRVGGGKKNAAKAAAGIDPKTGVPGGHAPLASPNAQDGMARGRTALERGYAYVIFNYNDCGEDTTLRLEDGSWAYRTTRFFPAYPDYDWGLLRAWAWGVSRIVDYLETDRAIDPHRLIVTGASRTGKSAMVAAAFDERLAMGAPVVTGGGGIGAYRYAGARGSEYLDLMVMKYPNWFSPHLHEFWGHVDKLPFDEHWFLALCAPRAFLALEGEADVISLPEAVRASIQAAKPVYALFHAEDRIGVNYAPHAHAFTTDDWNAMLDFADWQLSGRRTERRFDQYPTIAAPSAAQ